MLPLMWAQSREWTPENVRTAQGTLAQDPVQARQMGGQQRRPATQLMHSTPTWKSTVMAKGTPISSVRA